MRGSAFYRKFIFAHIWAKRAKGSTFYCFLENALFDFP